MPPVSQDLALAFRIQGPTYLELPPKECEDNEDGYDDPDNEDEDDGEDNVRNQQALICYAATLSSTFYINYTSNLLNKPSCRPCRYYIIPGGQLGPEKLSSWDPAPPAPVLRLHSKKFSVPSHYFF